MTRSLDESGPLPELISSAPMYDLVEHVKKQNVATRLKLRVEQDLPKGTTFEQYYGRRHRDRLFNELSIILKLLFTNLST